MASRLELQKVLESILESENVYFQPPPNFQMSYPAIVYKRSELSITRADNSSYTNVVGYTVTLIDKNPDSEVIGKLARLPMCDFDRHYKSDNLNHDVFRIFY